MRCISILYIAIRFNGSITETFHPSKGLKQEDAHLPLLYSRYMVLLSSLILEPVSSGFWKDIYYQSSIHVFNMSFADDIVIFGETDVHNVENMLSTIEWFYKISSQMINFSKFEIIEANNLSPDL